MTATTTHSAHIQDGHRRRRYGVCRDRFSGAFGRRAYAVRRRDCGRAPGAGAREPRGDRSGRHGPAAARIPAGSRWSRALRRLDAKRVPLLVFSGTIASAEEVRDLAALGVAGYVNEYSAADNILPALAPHLFPDSFNRRSSPRVRARHPDLVHVRQHDRRPLTFNISKGGLAIRTMNPLQAGRRSKRGSACPAARTRSTPSHASRGPTVASGWACSSRRSTPRARRPSTSSSITTSSRTGELRCGWCFRLKPEATTLVGSFRLDVASAQAEVVPSTSEAHSL